MNARRSLGVAFFGSVPRRAANAPLECRVYSSLLVLFDRSSDDDDDDDEEDDDDVPRSWRNSR